jgi:excisionase family DNA binding protein
MDQELLTIEQAAAFLQKHMNSVRRLLRQDKLPGVKVGGEWRIRKTDLIAMFEGRKPAASEGPAPNPARTGTAGD